MQTYIMPVVNRSICAAAGTDTWNAVYVWTIILYTVCSGVTIDSGVNDDQTHHRWILGIGTKVTKGTSLHLMIWWTYDEQLSPVTWDSGMEVIDLGIPYINGHLIALFLLIPFCPANFANALEYSSTVSRTRSSTIQNYSIFMSLHQVPPRYARV